MSTNYSVDYFSSFGSPWRFTIGSPSLTFDPKSNAQPQKNILDDIRRVAEQHSVDLAKVKEAIDRDEKEQKESLVASLKAVADLHVRKGTKGRRFQLVYWGGEKVEATEGIEWPVEYDEDGDVEGYNVLVDDYGHPFSCRYETMGDFREYFESSHTPYHIAYFD